MKFFIPHSKETTDIEKVYLGIVKFNNAQITDKRIFKLTYQYNNKTMIAEVGKQIDTYYKEGDQLVIAIVEMKNLYCVCLPARGVLRGVPIYVGKNEYSIHVEYFD